MTSVTQTHIYMSATTLKEIGDWVVSEGPNHSDGITLVIDPWDGTITAVDAFNERCRKFEAWPVVTRTSKEA